MAVVSVIVPSHHCKHAAQTVEGLFNKTTGEIDGTNIIGYIYLITNKKNNKKYVGQTTVTIENRWRGHVDASKKSPYPICKAIRKYGKNSFTIKKINEASTLEELNLLEPFYIDAYNSLVPNGYNLRLGGNNSLHHSDTKKKMSELKKGQPAWNKGIEHPEETKKKISDAKKGKPSPRKGIKLSDETKEKISKANKGKPGPTKGKKASVETREKISKARLGKGHPHTKEFREQMKGNTFGRVNKGVPKTEETKKKMKEAALKREQRKRDQKFAENLI